MIGALNPFPFRVGGGPTETSRAYRMLRSAVGTGGSARDDSGLDGLWRRSKAKGLAAATSATRRAIYNAFAHLATDALPYHERILGIVPQLGSSTAARRRVVVAQWVAQLSATIPELEDQLQRIDSRVSILSVDNAVQAATVPGRAFGDGVEAFGGSGASRLPNYATAFTLRIRFAVGYTGALGAGDARLREQLIEVLRTRVPSWVDWTITTSSGFVLGTSALDVTGFTGS